MSFHFVRISTTQFKPLHVNTEETVSHQMENNFGGILNLDFATAEDFWSILRGPSTDEYIELGYSDFVSVWVKTDGNYGEKNNLRL